MKIPLFIARILSLIGVILIFFALLLANENEAAVAATIAAVLLGLSICVLAWYEDPPTR